MSNEVEVNGEYYEDLTAGFDASGLPVDGIYYGVSKVAPNPTDSLKTVAYSKVAFPGTFDGVGTVELTYQPATSEVVFCLIGSLETVKTFKSQLNAVLVRSDGARYALVIPGCDSQQVKLMSQPKTFPDMPLGGKVLVRIHCIFERLSDD